MNVKTALVHDWLVTWRGGEKVLLELARLYPDAPIYTLFLDRDCLPDELKRRDIRVLKGLNRWRRFRKALLPILPWAIESIDLSEYDLIISTSSCVAKGARKRSQAKHLCYIHSPMRYAWDQKREYFGRLLDLPLVGRVLEFGLERLRRWDVSSARGVDLFIANSNFVAGRVKAYYGRDAVVIHPPIDLGGFPLNESAKGENRAYWLAAGALVSYKRFDLAIEAAEAAGMKLIVAGAGPEEGKLRSLGGIHTEFRISPPQSEWVSLLRNARALVFPGVEDFGMIAIEAMSCGTPVIASKAGGALDFIVEGKTGTFFEPGSKSSLESALRNFHGPSYDPAQISEYALGYSLESFKVKVMDQIKKLME